MPKIWKLKEPAPEAAVDGLPKYPKLLIDLLHHRGLTQEMDIETFLGPKYEGLYSPFLFLDMEKAVERIWRAIEAKEKMCIYGDYDADAVTANAVVQQTFRHLGVEVESYIPDRFTEGYGINMEALQKIKDKGCKIIITVDCGTNSRDAAEFCNANGMDLIITDHHEVIGELPKAFAIINPKNPEDKYPYHEITGVGVAFKLACGLLAKVDKVAPRLSASADRSGQPATYVAGWEKWLLDLVAIGTVADCHSLVGENRILVKYGLQVLAKTKWPGLRALIKTAKLDFSQKPPDTYTLGFVIAPRLNAAGRLEHADTALHLLMEEDPARAMERAEQLEEINRRRQDQTARIVSEAKDQVLSINDRKVLVLANEGWNKGIVGLVAGRLAEEYKKPVMVLEKGESEATGSARTVGEFDVVEALKFASDYLIRFGGHKQAAGLTLKNENLEKFYQKILEFAETNLRDEDIEQKLLLDAELAAVDLSLATCSLLLQLEPFGVDNHKPKFLIPQMEIISVKQVGKTGQHAQLQLKKDNQNISSIAFNFNLLEKNLNIGDTVDGAAELMQDDWNGNSKVKLRVIDVRNQANILSS